MGQEHDHDVTTPVERARAAAIEAAGFDPGDLVYMEDDEARAAYVDARAALLWSDVDLRELDDLAARKVAAWEVLDAVYEEEKHSAVRDCPSTRAMAQILKDARIARELTVDDVVERSGVSREVYTAIENLAYSVNVAELDALAPVVGLTVVEVLEAGQKAEDRAGSHPSLVVDETPVDSSPR
ncbi:helix-turn-helix transcriptional regulator [Prescottella equi]